MPTKVVSETDQHTPSSVPRKSDQGHKRRRMQAFETVRRTAPQGVSLRGAEESTALRRALRWHVELE